jgi:hypothetical protein
LCLTVCLHTRFPKAINTAVAGGAAPTATGLATANNNAPLAGGVVSVPAAPRAQGTQQGGTAAAPPTVVNNGSVPAEEVAIIL